MFVTDYIVNGRGHGAVGELLAACRFEPGYRRPYLDRRGRTCVTVNAGIDGQGKRKYKVYTARELMARGIAVNAATLRKDEWIQLDAAVLRARNERLRAWTDLESVSSYGGFDGMGKTILEHETMSDPGEALVDMDGLSESRNDAPHSQLEGIPLPITHSGFHFSARRLATSKNGNMPLDVSMAEAAGRRIAEKVEQTLIGTLPGMTYGIAANYSRSPTVYGYLNFPDRITKSDLTAPTGSNGDATVEDVLEMIELAADHNFFGPFMLYHSTDWDKWLDDDYYVSGGNNPNTTLRNRLRQIDAIQDVRRLDYLKASQNPLTFILVQMTSEVAQAVTAMPLTTLQWDDSGGMRINYKSLTIQVPRLRSDYYGNCGIVVAKTA